METRLLGVGSHGKSVFLGNYLIFILLFGIVQATFVVAIYDFLNRPNAFSAITSLKLYPTDAFILPLTALLVLFSFLDKRERQTNTSRRAILYVLWIIFCIDGIAVGLMYHNPFILTDTKNLLIRSLFAPLVFMLGTHAGLDKVLNKIVGLAMLPALFVGVNSFIHFMGRIPITDTSTSVWPGMAMLLPFSIALFLSLLRSQRGPAGLLAVGIFAFGCIADFWKPKVASLIICCAISLLLFLARIHNIGFKVKKIAKVALLALATAAALVVLMNISGYWIDFSNNLTRLISIDYLKNTAAIQDLSGNRFEIIKLGMGVWLREPYFGSGFGAPLSGYFLDYFTGAYIVREHIFPHNFGLQALYQLGVVGFGLLVLILALWIQQIIRTLKIMGKANDPYYLGILSFCITILAVSLFSEIIVSDALGYLFWVSMGLEAAYAYQFENGSMLSGATVAQR